MHDFTASILHEDRMAGFERDAEASRLAWMAKGSPDGLGLRARIQRSVRKAIARFAPTRPRPEHLGRPVEGNATETGSITEVARS